jgi:hypothetical protein
MPDSPLLFTFADGVPSSMSPTTKPCTMNRLKCFVPPTALMLFLWLPHAGHSQDRTVSKDSIVYHIIYRDTIVYRYDTVMIKHYVHSDTLWTTATAPAGSVEKSKGLFNRNSWGIGPILGAYYSPYHGFDVSVGFGIQYFLFAVPSFRNPHMGSRKGKK